MHRNVFTFGLKWSSLVIGYPDYPSHMTHIEVVVDRDFKVVNGGAPLLVAMEQPRPNTMYRKPEGAHQGNGAGIKCSISLAVFALVPAIRLVF